MLGQKIGATPRRNQSLKSSPVRAKVFGAGRPRPLDAAKKSRLARHARALRAAGRISPHYFVVFEGLLFNFHNAKSGLCFPSYQRIAADLHVGVSTAQRAVAALELLGLLVVVNRLQWQTVDVPGLGRQRRPRRTSNGYSFALPDVAAGVAAAASRPARSVLAADAANLIADASEGSRATLVALPSSSALQPLLRQEIGALAGPPRPVPAPVGRIDAGLWSRLGVRW